MSSLGNALGEKSRTSSSVDRDAPQEPPHSGESFLRDMLTAMDHHVHVLRDAQQGLVAVVELACIQALGRAFHQLVLVGSAALRVETPGSDVDVVCFTQSNGEESAGMPVESLRKVHKSFSTLVNQYANSGASISTQLIEDARVPILRVLWGPPGHAGRWPRNNCIAVDVSVDQSRPVEHVRWFQSVGAAPSTRTPALPAPLVTLTLRCVKWWLRQRQIPRRKDGGLPTLAWLLMTVHVCFLPDTREQAGTHRSTALMTLFMAFFAHYSAPDGLDGVLSFAPDNSTSEFKHPATKKAMWGELSVIDPTRDSSEPVDLAPHLTPATQLLISHELRRANLGLRRIPRIEPLFGESRKILEEMFEPLPDGANSLPSFTSTAISVLLLWGEDAEACDIELGMVDRILPRLGWNASFLHRTDDRSELHTRLYDVDERTGRCRRKKIPNLILCPVHFICNVNFEKHGSNMRLEQDGLERFREMKRVLVEMRSRQQPVDMRAADCLAAGTQISSGRTRHRRPSHRESRSKNKSCDLPSQTGRGRQEGMNICEVWRWSFV